MKKRMILGFVVVLAFGLGGCATKGDFTSLRKALNVDLLQLSKKMDAVETKVEELSAAAKNVPAPAPAAVKAPANAPKEEKAAPAAKTQTATLPPAVPAIAPEVITDLQTRVGTLETRVQPLEAKVSGTDEKLGALDKQLGVLDKRIKNIEIRVVRVNKAVGATLELTGKSGERYFLVGPFGSGSADIKGGLDGQMKKLSALMGKEGLVATKIVGFSDTAPFKSAKDAAENVNKNLELAKNRASAIAKSLGRLGDGAETLGRGVTEQFNGRDANRCVMVVVIKKPTTTTAPAAATSAPATPAPAQTAVTPVPAVPAPVPPVPPAAPATPPAKK